ncbi:fibrinogen-binding adhesin SdrG C-terminal domain-containing protein [Murdochiella sp. Marseille-P8839]|nr:fibrinogen-binding adhesin SdrG C-terminal domain-containing protein [Murdochiella sp. Marseille-P8839]
MNEQRSKKRMTKLLAMLLAFFMVLSFALPNKSETSFADSNDADEASLFSLLNNGKMNDGEPSGVPGAPGAPVAAQQAAGTYITVKDQYGNPVDNVYFNIDNTYNGIRYFGKAVNGALYIYNSATRQYEQRSLESAGFMESRYHKITVNTNTTVGDTTNYNVDPNAILAQFYIQGGVVMFSQGSANLILQSKAKPPAPVGDAMTAKDTKGKPAPGIAFLLYKEGEPNIQANLLSDSKGALTYTANANVFDARTLAAGTYTVKVTPQSSSDTAKATYVMDATKIYATFTVTDDGAGNKTVAFSPASSQNLVFPLIADLPKGEAKLTVNKTDEKGDPLSGVTFQLQGPVDSAAAGTRTSGPTGADGKTTFTNLAYGEYLLTELSAPDGYVVSKQVIHVMLGKDADTPIVGGTDVTKRLTLDSVTWNPPHVENGVNTIYPNQAESLSVDAVIQVPATARLAPGDFFTIQLSDNVDTYGLVQSKEQGLDIFADGGKLAEGKFDPTTRTITYTFTNLVKTFTANQIKLHTVLFIDKVKVPQEAKSPSTVTLSYGLRQTTPSTSSFQVFYRPYYYPQQTGGSNIGTMYSIYNPDKKTATTYIYVNPLTNKLKKGKLEISGKGSVLINALTDVKVYDGGSGSTDTMVPSWGVVPTNLTEVNDLSPVIDGNANKVTIDFGDRLDTGSQAYIVKVTTGYDPSSTEDLGMVAKLYGYFNGYWSRYYNYSYYDYDWAAAQTYMKFYEHEGTATGIGFDAEVTVSNPKNSIEWTKVNASGLPLEGAEFRLVRVQEGSEQTVIDKLVSNRDGRLSVSGLAPGSYKLYETKAPEGYEIPKDDTGKDKPLATFTVNDKGEIQNPDPADGKIVNGRLEGRFSVHKTDNAENEADRKPLKDTEFTLTPLKEDAGSWIVDTDKSPITKTTDAEGNLTFSALAIGKYQLKETKPSPGYVLRDTTWTVEVKEEVVDEAHPEIKRVVTTVTEDASPSLARSAAFGSASVSFGRELVPTSTKDTYLAPLLDHTMQRLQKAQDLLSSDAQEETSSFADGMLYSADAPLRSVGAPLRSAGDPLRSAGAGKYQYYNPVEVNGTKWPANVQEMDVDGDGQADYKITQTMEPDGTTPGQYKAKVKVEKMPETLELVVLMDNCSAFAQRNGLTFRAGDKIDRAQWGGIVGGTIEPYPTMYDWVDYYFRGVKDNYNNVTQEGRVTQLLQLIEKKYPNAKVTLLGAGGRNLKEPYRFNKPYISQPIGKAIQFNKGMNPTVEDNRNAPQPTWDFTGFYGRAGLQEAMNQAYQTLNQSDAKKKSFFYLQGFPNIMTYTWWWDAAKQDFANIKNVAQVNWLVELDPSAYDNTFLTPGEYRANGLPDPSQVHILQNTLRYWTDKDQYWNQVDKAAMESAYNQAISAIAQEITNDVSSDTKLNLQIQLADNVLWRTAPSVDASMTTAGVSYDAATGSLTKSDFTMTSDKPLTFNYYIKANSQASGAKLNVFENINRAKTSGLQVNTTKPDGTVESTTSAIPIPQLRIPGWETTVTKYWYGNSDADNASFQTFPEAGETPPTAPTSSLDTAKRKASQVLIYSNTVYSDDPETKIGLGQKLKSPYESLAFTEALPYYDNDGKPITYQATEYHDPIFHTKMNLVKNDTTLKQTFHIGAQMDPVVVKTDIFVTNQWGSGTKPEDQVPVTAKLLAFRKNTDGSETPLTDAELETLIGEGKPTSITLDAKGNWKGAFTDLPTSQVVNGQATEIVYRVKEVPLPGFDVSYLYDFQEVTQLDGTTKPTHYVTIVNQKHTLVSVTNVPNEVDFYKVNGSGKALAGATFTLQKETETPGTWADVAGYVDIATVQVTETGVQREKLHFEKLDPGNYRLNETTVPTGYKEPTNPVATFTVSETTGKVEKVKALNASGVLTDGSSGVAIFNVSKDRPGVDFYLDKRGGVQGETLHRLTSGTLVMKLEKTDDTSKSMTVTFDLSQDYENISNTGTRGLKITIPADWPAGDYVLSEVTAPAGYQKMAGTITLRYTVPEDLSSTTGRTLGVVDAQGNVQTPYLFEETQIGGVWTPTYATGYAPLAIENYVFVLPSTAGPGTFFFTLAGTFLLGLAMSLRIAGSKPRPRRRRG